MKRILLVKAASWLYHNDPYNKIRLNIYSLLDNYGLHSDTEIDCKIDESILFYVEKAKFEEEKIKKANDLFRKRIKSKRI